MLRRTWLPPRTSCDRSADVVRTRLTMLPIGDASAAVRQGLTLWHHIRDWAKCPVASHDARGGEARMKRAFLLRGQGFEVVLGFPDTNGSPAGTWRSLRSSRYGP